MKFQQVMAFFLTGATALSMSTTALAADLSDNVDTTVSATQTADEQENNLYTKNDKDLTDAEFEQKYELPENSWFTPAVRYVIENNIMLPAGHIDGKEYFPWFNPAENRCTVAEAIYNSAKLVDPELTASYAGMAVKEAPDYAEIPELYRDGASFCFESGIMTGDSQHYLRPYDSISRQEFAAVLQRYITLLEKAGKITVSTDTSANTAFTDASSIAPWAKDAVAFCQTNKLMNGDNHPRDRSSRLSWHRCCTTCLSRSNNVQNHLLSLITGGFSMSLGRQFHVTVFSQNANCKNTFYLL